MKYITALFRSADVAEAVRADLVAQGVPAEDVRMIGRDADGELDGLDLPDAVVADYRQGLSNGEVVLAAHVDDERAEIVQAAMGGAGENVDEDELRKLDGDGQLIAPAGKPLGAVGATSTIGAADDGRQTYRDPMEPRES